MKLINSLSRQIRKLLLNCAFDKSRKPQRDARPTDELNTCNPTLNTYTIDPTLSWLRRSLYDLERIQQLTTRTQKLRLMEKVFGLENNLRATI